MTNVFIATIDYDLQRFEDVLEKIYGRTIWDCKPGRKHTWTCLVHFKKALETLILSTNWNGNLCYKNLPFDNLWCWASNKIHFSLKIFISCFKYFRK